MQKSIESKADNIIANVSGWSRDQLVATFRELCGKPPPHGTSMALLQRMVSYELQLRAAGGLTPEQKKLFAKCLAAAPGTQAGVWERSTHIKSGTRLNRIWKGRNYEVVVAGDGFRLDGVTYNSLSEAARAITGTRWNGHVFFGLKKGASHATAA